MQYTLKKSLGQHFLHHQPTITLIVDAIKESMASVGTHQLVEIGPGAGAITDQLFALENIDFKAIELDREKVEYLLRKYPVLQGKIIEDDVLKTPVPFETPFVLCGNFPYNISTQILFRLIEWQGLVPQAVGMFQKEVAQRVASRPGSKVYGVISVLIQAFYDVDYLFDVPPEAFTPAPKVQSGVIRLRRRTKALEVASYAKLQTLVKTAFNQRRKMLRNGLKPLFDTAFLSDERFSKRAEQLSLEDFAALTFHMR